MHPLLRELEFASAGVLAAEKWAPTYARAPIQHAALIKQTIKLQRLTMLWLRDYAERAPQMIDWYAYARAVIEQQHALRASEKGQIEAYNVDVIINQNAAANEDQQFIKVVFDTVATIQALGADSMETEFGIPISLTSTSAIIQDLTTGQLANLVGMKIVDRGKPTEHLIQNPDPVFQIDETTRKKIAQSIKKSIQLGKNQKEAAQDLVKFVGDAKRAEMIAYTESVRAYATGRKEYASQSGAVAKRWYDSNATDICADNTAQGWIAFDEDFLSGDEMEPAHIYCKCNTIYSYDKGDLEEAGLDSGDDAPDDSAA